MSGANEPTPGLDLLAERLGGRAVAANDEFFAEKENLVKVARAIWIDDKYTDRGKWMDGWETRRRRVPGHDWCVLALGLPGAIHEVVVDTAFFRGNYPEACSIEGAALAPGSSPSFTDGGVAIAWLEILPRTPLQGDTANRFPIAMPWRFTHLRLNIYPDGGVARFRAYGSVIPDRRLASDDHGRTDLAAVGNGGYVLAASDMFFSNRNNLILPGPSLNMGDGWETKRRRGPGHDWVIVRLATEARLSRVVIDTQHYKGNAPGSAELDGLVAPRDADPEALRARADWRPLLARTPLRPDHAHEYSSELADAGPITHVRLAIHPDGGVARLRLYGEPTAVGRAAVAIAWLDALPPAAFATELAQCCAAPRFLDTLASSRPFGSRAALDLAIERALAALTEDDLRDAMRRHPRIGEAAAQANTTATEARWSAGEQAGVAQAGAGVRDRLRELNRVYEQRFGWVFLVCATGLSADELAGRLEARLGNDPATELAIAGREMCKIARLRVDKLLAP